MFKELIRIFLNQLKVKGFQVVLEAMTSTMLEFNRKSNSGDFDLRNQNQNQEQNKSVFPLQQKQNESKGFFNFFK